MRPNGGTLSVREINSLFIINNYQRNKINGLNTHVSQQNISLMAAGIPDLLSAHHIVLRYVMTIPKKSHQELQNYKQPVSFVCVIPVCLQLVFCLQININY